MIIRPIISPFDEGGLCKLCRQPDAPFLQELGAVTFALEECRSKLAALEAQLPDGMKHCTILFRECEKGHGWLTATNWVDFPCPTCQVEGAKKNAKYLKSLLREAYPHIGDEYARSWPDDPEFDEMKDAIADVLGIPEEDR